MSIRLARAVPAPEAVVHSAVEKTGAVTAFTPKKN